MRDDSEHGLLFGVIALRENFIDRTALNEALRAWANDQTQGLEHILQERCLLSPEQFRLLEGKVRQQLDQTEVSMNHADREVAPGESPETEHDLSLIARWKGAVTTDDGPPTASRSDPTVSIAYDPIDRVFSAARSSSAMRYQILRPLALGGIGEVYVARDTELNREVALKLIQERYALHAPSRRRFLFEAEITSALEHPGIAPVHGHGLLPDGRPYYTMRLIDGERFKDAIQKFHRTAAAGQAPEIRARELRLLLQRFLDVCNVIEYAHSRDVLHRDLKPSNIMLGPYGETLVVDWGLAKSLSVGNGAGGASDGELNAESKPTEPGGFGNPDPDHSTLPGTALGTPNFMSPEQAAGESETIGKGTDVYGLGATLYFLLTGKPPCNGPDVLTILNKVRAGEIAAPCQALDWVSKALDAICMKALAHKPSDRYASARELAIDIEHWLADDPVSTFLDPLSVRLTRWGRRNRVVAVGIGVLLLSAVFGLTLGTFLLSKANWRTVLERNRAQESARTLERQVYINRVHLAQRECLENNIAAAEKLLDLCPPALRGWEWFYVARLCHQEKFTFHGHDQRVNAVAFSPDGTKVVSGSGKTFYRPKARDQARLLLWDAANGSISRRFEGLRGAVHAVSFSPDGKWIVSGSGFYADEESNGEGRVRVWDAETGRSKFDYSNGDGNALCVAFSPDGRRVAAGFGKYTSDSPGRLMVFEVSSRKVVFDRKMDTGAVQGLAFHPDGRTLASAGNKLVELWDVDKNERLGNLTGHTDWVFSVAFHPDGRRLVSGGKDGSVRIWDMPSRAEKKRIEAHAGVVLSVCFSPDGTKLASSGDDGALRLWDPATGQQQTTLRGHASLTTGVPGLAFSPDGKQLVSGGGDHTAKLWDVTTDQQVTFHGQKEWITSLLCLPDRTTVVSGSSDHSIALWDIRTGHLLRNLPEHDEWIFSLAISPDARLLASSGASAAVRIRDVAGPGVQLVRAFKGHGVFVRSVAFSPDGRTLVSAGNNENFQPLRGEVFLWDVATGHRLKTLIKGNASVFNATFSPDGSLLAVVLNGRRNPTTLPAKVIVYEWPSFRERYTISDPSHVGNDEDAGNGGRAFAFSPDGRRLAFSGSGGTLLIHNSSDGRHERTIVAHAQEVASLVFSPDGRRLASSGFDKLIKLFDVSTGEEVLILRGHKGGVVSLVFSPTGDRLTGLGCSTFAVAVILELTGRPELKGDTSLMRAKMLLITAIHGLSISMAFPAHAADPARPNILVILSDDVGWAEYGFQGSKDIPTPHIDSIAKGGVRFTQGYVSGPYCSPTRAGLMTGRYQTRFGHENNRVPAVSGLPLAETTIADRLRDRGYATCAVGKWHLGVKPEFRPTRRGFDEFFGTLANTPYYHPTQFVDSRISTEVRPVDSEDFYTTEQYSTRAVDWLEKNKARPWFLYLPFNAQHAPLQAPKKYLDRFPNITDETRKKFAACMSAMDDAVGTVLAKVRELGQEENTLIVFLSDNGGPTRQTTSSNGPLRGFKATTWEGGVRVPFCMQWKGSLPAGKTYDHPIIQLDILPTALAAAGARIDPAWRLDGVDLKPYLKGERTDKPHETLYWRFGEQWAVRHGDWKLLVGRAGSGKPELYNLSEDPGEAKDLASLSPEKLNELRRIYDRWNAEQAPPITPMESPNPGAAAKKAARKKAAAKKAADP